MRKSIVLLLTLLLLSACVNAPSSGMSGAASEENSAVSETASASNHEIPLLTPLRPDQKTEILACFNEGRFDTIELSLGASAEEVERLFGLGKKTDWGNGGDGFKYGNVLFGMGISPGDAEGRNYCVIAIEAGDKTPVYGMVVGQTTITEARSIFADYYLIDEGVSKGDVFCDGSYDPSTAGNYELVYYQTDPQESNEGQNDTALVLEFKEDLLCKATLIK